VLTALIFSFLLSPFVVGSILARPRLVRRRMKKRRRRECGADAQ
jgi:hypothetical protein